MGEVAERVGRFVTAYSSDLRDESLDGQRVVVGGIVTGVRTVITKAKASMAIVTLEDLQGTIEVVVFPRLYEQTMGTWRDGEILLVAGRVDHKRRGGLAAGRPRGRVGRGGGGRRGCVRAPGRRRRTGWRRPARQRLERHRERNGGNGHGNGPRPGVRRSAVGRSCRSGRVAAAAVGPGVPGGHTAAGGPVRLASPRRGAGRARGRRASLPPIAPAEPVSTYPETAGAAQGPDQDDEPPVPDEARARIVADATADAPVDAGPGHDPPRPVRRERGAGPGRRRDGDVQGRAARSAGRDEGRDPRPGDRRGAALPMELRRGVAYDAELLAEVRRRLGDGLIDLRLA